MSEQILATPKPTRIETVPDPDCPTGLISKVFFDRQELEGFAKANPSASFRVKYEDGRSFPFPISMPLYRKDRKGNV